MNLRRTLLALLLVLPFVPSLAAAAPVPEMAVIAHPGVKVDNLSMAELKKILLGDQQYWPGGQTITLLVRAPVSAERTLLLNKIYKMTEAQFRQYWVAKVFRAETASGPKVVLSNEMATDLVAGITGAIALVDSRSVPAGVKVLAVDGKKPGEAGYPLK